MDQVLLREFEARCTQEAMPRCRAACPLRMDVRAFMEHMAENRLREAGKILERHLPLPEIMARICDHPCEARCLRRDLGGSLAVGALEAVCIEAVGRQGKILPRSPKTASIAVLGNGLAGLTAGFELSRKAYPVRIFYEEESGAFLARRFPRLPEKAVAREMEELRKASCVFERGALDMRTLEEARSAHAAVFVDADAASELFTALGGRPEPAGGLIAERLCAGGMLTRSATGALYASASGQAGEGRRAALTLERCVSGVSLTAGREGELDRESSLHTPLDGIAPLPAVLARADVYTPEEAAAEAGRCIRCECLACVRECVYLQKYGSYPRSYTRQIYNNASIVKGEHLANALINGCALCGQCRELCPERFSMAELCLSARRDMVRRNYMPPSAHEFAMEDMDNANGEACSLFMGDPARHSCAYALFPGCQLAASRGDQIRDVYAALRGMLSPGEGLGLFLCCCGVPAHWAGREEKFRETLAHLRSEWEKLGKPVLVMACASCMKSFREAAADIPVISLWEMLDRRCPFPPSPEEGAEYSIHDPCAARNDAAWREATRSLARKAGLRIAEPRRTGRETPCCGYGGLVWSAQPELAEAFARRRAEELPLPALASCIMCRDNLANSGKDCLHLLDILPFSKPEEGGDPARVPPPGLSARRANRAALRGKMLGEYFGDAPEEPSFRVDIEPPLLARLERKHILRRDVEEAVLAAHAGGKCFLERQSGQFIGSRRPRNVTFWVRYSVEEGERYRLHDAWCHRMLVPGTGEEETR